IVVERNGRAAGNLDKTRGAGHSLSGREAGDLGDVAEKIAERGRAGALDVLAVEREDGLGCGSLEQAANTRACDFDDLKHGSALHDPVLAAWAVTVRLCRPLVVWDL